MISASVKNGVEVVTLQNDSVRVSVVPEIGGRMIEFRSLKTGNQFLMEGRADGIQHRGLSYGSEFSGLDAYGFDECFPTIEPSVYPSDLEDDANMDFPDHGELWTRPWRFEIKNDELVLNIHGVQTEYFFRKTIRLIENGISIEYFLKNFRGTSFNYLWSAHPLLNVDPGDQIILPKDISEVLINWASDQRLGKFGDLAPWPLFGNDGKLNYSIVQNTSVGKAVKCFSNILADGYAALYHAKSDESIVFKFDPREIPYIGIWLCYGGWPAAKNEKQLTVGLEPSKGRPDSLESSILRNECSTIDAGGEERWSLNISIQEGRFHERRKLEKLTNGFSERHI